MSNQIQKVRKLLDEKQLDGLILQKPENRRYIAGFTGSTGYVIVTKNEAYFMTDFRYIEQANKQCHGYTIVEISKENPITNEINKLGVNRLGIEEDFLTFGQYKEFTSKLAEVELVPLEGAITKVRAVKSEEEINRIAKAASIADEGFAHILTFIKPGIREIDVALELEFFMRKKGASKVSFDAIIASGTRSSLPHGIASDKIIEDGDMITLDFGCVYEGYCSDMTRTIVLGKANEKQKEIYYSVLEAQQRSLEAVKPGITGEELDQIARNIIKDKGYGNYFGHGLGHGVGLEVHELPHVNILGKNPMEPGMVITIEPGIYLPGFGGVRIEDLVVVTEDSYRVLSKSTKDLIELEI